LRLPRPAGRRRPRGPSSAGEQVSSFVAQGNRWPTSNLSYGFQEITQDLPANTVRAAIVAAFNLWAQAAPLTFTESPTPRSSSGS
jgi:hypothetical protein